MFTGVSPHRLTHAASCPAIAIYADCVNWSALPGIHFLRCLSEKQDVDGRDIRREDSASRFLPGHDDMGDNRFYLPAIVTRSRIISDPGLFLTAICAPSR